MALCNKRKIKGNIGLGGREKKDKWRRMAKDEKERDKLEEKVGR